MSVSSYKAFGRYSTSCQLPRRASALAARKGTGRSVTFEDKDSDDLIVTESQTSDPNKIEVLERNLYYPFGLTLEGVWNSETDPLHRYKFNMNEKIAELGKGVHDFNFRYYDGAIGRFWQVDPMTELAPAESPYSFSFNNPILFWDPLGLYGSKRKAERKQRKATRKLGVDRVGDVYYNESKDEYAFIVHGEGKDKHTRIGTNESGETTVSADRGYAIYGKKDYKNFKRSEGLYTAFYASVNWEFTFGGGASFEFGYIQDRFGGSSWYRTVGGGVGLNLGVGINAGGIQEEHGNEFRVHMYQGAAFQYGAGIGPLSINRTGDFEGDKHTGFKLRGDRYTAIEGGGGPGSLKWTKLSKLSNFEFGASYHWTRTWLFSKNKAAIEDTPKP